MKSLKNISSPWMWWESLNAKDWKTIWITDKMCSWSQALIFRCRLSWRKFKIRLCRWPRRICKWLVMWRALVRIMALGLREMRWPILLHKSKVRDNGLTRKIVRKSWLKPLMKLLKSHGKCWRRLTKEMWKTKTMPWLLSSKPEPCTTDANVNLIC